METLIPQRKRLAGFTLIEMAIVIALAAIMLSAGLTLLLGRMAATQLDTTQKRQEAIKQALINYLGQNKRLPCPGDSSGAEVRSATAPLLPCGSYSGIVPYQTLGLDRTAALDGWENFITYVVSPNPIANPPTPPLTTALLYTFKAGAPQSNSITPTGSLAFWPSTSTGGIRVAQTVATSPPLLIANPTNATGAAVVLISHGKNGYGAFNVKGTNAQPPTTNVDEQQNADATKLITGTPPTVTVVKRDTTESTTAVGGPFDDIVMILSANDLTGPLIANGTLQSSAQAVLSQANDFVLGNIVSTRVCSSSSSSCKDFKYIIPIPIISACSPTVTCFPPNVAAWGMSYKTTSVSVTQFTTIGGVDILVKTPPDNDTAYILTAGDGTTRTITIGELRGILTRGAGFN